MVAIDGLPSASAGAVLTLMTFAHAVSPPGIRLTDQRRRGHPRAVASLERVERMGGTAETMEEVRREWRGW